MTVGTILLFLWGAAPPWPVGADAEPLSKRLVVPDGYTRIDVPAESFGDWLRQLPVKPGRPKVRLHDGSLKGNQRAQHLVLDVDVGSKDLQQCADAVMRLFAEWQWSANAKDAICFRYTSGHEVPWSRWSKGYRPRIRGSKVSFSKRSQPSADYETFRRYLDSIFTYAGTASLSRDLSPVRDPAEVTVGDVFIQGGHPGHAVLVIDVVEDDAGRRMFALAQSYMPAQEIHVLENPAARGPWYAAKQAKRLETPEWTFEWSHLARFHATGCPSR